MILTGIANNRIIRKYPVFGTINPGLELSLCYLGIINIELCKDPLHVNPELAKAFLMAQIGNWSSITSSSSQSSSIGN